MYACETYHHFLHLAADSHARHFLEVLQACKDLVLDLELGLHAEGSTLLDGEGLALESVDCTRRPQVNDDVLTTVDFEAEREYDALAGVAGVGDVLALAETEGCFPLLERLVILVCGSVVSTKRRTWVAETCLASGTRQWSSSRRP